MRTLACSAAVSAALTLLFACSSGSEDGGATSTDALTSLTAAQCKTPSVHTSPRTDASGASIAGSAHTTLSGCIVGAQGETGEEVLARLTALLSDTTRLATVTDTHGAPVFQHFSPGARHGALASASGLTQDIDVTLAMSYSPHTTLHTVQKRPAGAAYTMSIVNATNVDASVAFFTVTAVEQGDLSLDLEVKAVANGITVVGASDIVLQQQQSQAAQASVLVSELFTWLQTQLAKSAPPPHPVTPPAPSDAGAAHDAAADATGGGDSQAMDGGIGTSDGSAADGGGD